MPPAAGQAPGDVRTVRPVPAISVTGSAARNDTAERMIAGGAGLLALSVLADSAVEHYRGSFANPAMVLPLAASAISLAVNGRQTALPGGARAPLPGDGMDEDDRPRLWRGKARPLARAAHLASVVVGAAGFGFHLFNIGKQTGGYILNNFFYKAPLGAPGALVFAGTLGAAADALTRGEEHLAGVPLRSGRVLGAATALGICGNVAEVALLHFRGAYHNPAMWIPVALPPVAAMSLARDAIEDRPRKATMALLSATAAMGLIGSAFHAYGVSRNMGGFRNWKQTILQGPPMPAPPSFTGLALIGLGALLLMGRRRAHG